MLRRSNAHAAEVVVHDEHPSNPSATPPAAINSAVRFAVCLAGGLVTLAYGVEVCAGSLGQALSCAYQTPGCSSGFTTAEDFYLIPGLVGGAFLIVVAAVLFVLARRSRG